MMRDLVVTPLLAIPLTLALGGAALADPAAPVSIFAGTYFGMSDDQSAIAFTMPDGHVRREINMPDGMTRCELNGIPQSLLP